MTSKLTPATSATATSSGTGSLSGKKRKYVNVHLLNGDQHLVQVDVKTKFQEVFNQVAVHLSIRETEYFGLAFKKDDEYHFILLDEKIHKLAPKQWKAGPGEGLDSQGQALINVWFRIQYYVDQVILLRERVTRHQYYLQLKENVVLYNHLYNEDKCLQLAAYALQADRGNFVPEKHESGYFNPSLYFPHWMIERHGIYYLEKNVPTLHKELHNMTRNDAELRYIKMASTPPGAHNLHLYTVRKRKSDKVCNTWLAVCSRGVEVYEDDAGYKNHISTFLWKDIGKLYFDKKKFEIRSVQSAGGRRFMYYTDCDVKSKYLLNIARGTHMFQMAIQPKLMEIQHLDNEDQKRYRESHIYSSESRDRSLLSQSPSKSASMAGGSGCNPRYSLISDVSSNTTSGIVSDRLAASFDDGDDHSHSQEIMIDSPPRGLLSATPNQGRTKFQLLSSFKQSNKTSPSHLHRSLELFKDSRKSSPQDLSPSSSNGSWRARHVSNPACLKGYSSVPLPLPSPTTPTQDFGFFPSYRRSAGRRGSLSKQYLHGSLLMTSGDRNTSGDSAVSVSGIFSGSDKLAPLSLPPADSQASCASGSSSSFTPQSGRSRSPPSSLSFSPNLLPKDSGGLDQLRPLSSPREREPQSKPPSSPRERNENLGTLSGPRANIPEQYNSPRVKNASHSHDKTESKPLGSPRSALLAEQFEFQIAPEKYRVDSGSPRLESLASAQVGKLKLDRLAKAKSEVTQLDDALMSDITPSSVTPIEPPQKLLTLSLHHSNPFQYDLKSQQHQPVMSMEDYHFQQLKARSIHHQQQGRSISAPHKNRHLQPSSSFTHASLYKQPILSRARDHYAWAQHHKATGAHGLMHQNTADHQEPGLDNQKALLSFSHGMPTTSNGSTDLARLKQRYGAFIQQQQSQVDAEALQQQRQLQQLFQQPHGTQLGSEAHVPYPFGSDKNTYLTHIEQTAPLHAGNMVAIDSKEIEENKENFEERPRELCTVPSGAPDKVDHQCVTQAAPSPGKSNLHPELKQILGQSGQSHAISLPLITALCNDSTLMQDSRSQSGSRSSYDTSTVRSTDSRLTRYSHDIDSRRWSSCGQAAGHGAPESSSRPYSWHSEHFDLDFHLAEAATAVDKDMSSSGGTFLPPKYQHLLPVSVSNTPANPRAVTTTKHVGVVDIKGKVGLSGATGQNSGVAESRMVHYLLPPQKMIESDPGPSSRSKPDGKWDGPVAVTGLTDPQASSWTDVIPYRLPIHQHMLTQRKQSSGVGGSNPSHQRMVPHKLSSGGHRDSESSMSHKQMMKENIGMA